jgi:hypothetical protein
LHISESLITGTFIGTGRSRFPIDYRSMMRSFAMLGDSATAKGSRYSAPESLAVVVGVGAIEDFWLLTIVVKLSWLDG